MTEFKYESQAKRGETMPDGLSWVEQGTYQAIALLTVRYRNGSIDAETAKREMGYIRKAFDKGMDQEKYIYRMVKLWVDIELTASNFNKNETIENARLMRDVIYGFNRLTEAERNKLLEEV